MINNEHNRHHLDTGHMRFPWEGSLGLGRSQGAHGTAQALTGPVPTLLVAENGAALRSDFVLPAPDISFQFSTLLIITMDCGNNGL